MSNRAGLMPVAALAILVPHLAVAQAASYKILHTFKGNPDGAEPRASVIVDPNGVLYGTTYRGGTLGAGTVYKLTPATGGAWQEAVLYSFGANTSYPRANVVFGKGGVLYGTTASSAVYELAPPPTEGGAWTETVLANLDTDGSNTPDGAVLIGPGGTLYTTTQGYPIPGGTAVAIVPPSTPGEPWTTSRIYAFAGASGSSPFAGLVSESGALYGTNYLDGDDICTAYGCGVVYELSPPTTRGGAWAETTIHTFTGSPSDGAGPQAALTAGPGGVLYGTTRSGGAGTCDTPGTAAGCGTVFQLTPSAPGGTWTESVIYSFTATNGDGAYPVASVVVGRNGELYGTTSSAGSAASDSACPSSYFVLAGCGIVFQLTPPTTPGGAWTEKVLHSFTGQNGDGSMPLAGLALSSTGVLYGTTSAGGLGAGTVFSIKP